MSEKNDQSPVKGKLPARLIVMLVALVAAVGLWFLRGNIAENGEQGAGGVTSAVVTSEQIETIVGRWLRPDGGYILEIRGSNEAGNLDVGYFNPRPINVSQAQVANSPKGLHIFIELQDKGYPGATYSLDYDSDKDILTGIYVQPAVNQSFEVYFVRAQ